MVSTGGGAIFTSALDIQRTRQRDLIKLKSIYPNRITHSRPFRLPIRSEMWQVQVYKDVCFISYLIIVSKIQKLVQVKLLKSKILERKTIQNGFGNGNASILLYYKCAIQRQSSTSPI